MMMMPFLFSKKNVPTALCFAPKYGNSCNVRRSTLINSKIKNKDNHEVPTPTCHVAPNIFKSGYSTKKRCYTDYHGLGQSVSLPTLKSPSLGITQGTRNNQRIEYTSLDEVARELALLRAPDRQATSSSSW